MKRVCVIGSLNVDLVTTVESFPKPGETVVASTFEIFTGGKGANQAVALGRLGADVMMVGKLGDRLYGPEYLDVLGNNQVNADAVMVEKDTFPGIAPVTVDKNSDNTLIAFPGANMLVDVDYIKEKWELISQRDIFLFQLEIPMETNLYAMRELKQMGKIIILDPAPARELPEEIFDYVDYITPNETELETLSGVTIREEEDIEAGARRLLDKGAKTVIAKAGKKGAYIVTKEGVIHVPGFKVKAIDPTAAGDSFNAGFAYGLAQGKNPQESARFANGVAGLSTTALGAQSAMPTLEEVESFLAQQK